MKRSSDEAMKRGFHSIGAPYVLYFSVVGPDTRASSSVPGMGSQLITALQIDS